MSDNIICKVIWLIDNWIVEVHNLQRSNKNAAWALMSFIIIFILCHLLIWNIYICSLHRTYHSDIYTYIAILLSSYRSSTYTYLLSWQCPGHVLDMSWTCPFVLVFGFNCYSSRTLSDLTLVSPMSSWSPTIWVMSNLIAAKVKSIEPNANILCSNVSIPFLNAFRLLNFTALALISC